MPPPLKTTPPLQCNPLRHVLLTLTSDYIPMKRLWGSVQCSGVTGCVGVWGWFITEGCLRKGVGFEEGQIRATTRGL